eukprot:3224878-Amphidinium_carterae.2
MGVRISKAQRLVCLREVLLLGRAYTTQSSVASGVCEQEVVMSIAHLLLAAEMACVCDHAAKKGVVKVVKFLTLVSAA